ncbi:capsule assembly Wzi family protein [Mucilaginibacter sp.]|uniref:capsule assembly Wzi family protein n=1 Tax=Mucilaginibacter sp. TaxID=1882438 RepID=UPI0035BC7F4E
MRIIKVAVICMVMQLIQYKGYSQSLPVGTVALEDYYRNAQLLSTADTNVSFTVRPVFPALLKNAVLPFYPDNTEKRYNLLNMDAEGSSKNGKFKWRLMPMSFQTQFNSHHPYGWNDGAMIPSKGLQTLTSAGVYLEYGPLSVQFKPELITAANSDFETLNNGHYDVIFARYYDIYNNIDLPARFGTDNYTKLYWGQSSIRLNYKALSFGLSTENLWWGPGIRSSLLMSNTAPGFAHLTLNSLKPIETPIGSFEGQLIAGRLENSNFAPLTPDHSYFGTNLYIPKPNDWRYLAGLVLTWQPKWVPGLFLGFDQTSQTYGKNLSGIRDYLPFFSPVKKNYAPNNAINKQDQRNAVFMRWLWPQEHAEVYFEYGHSNNTNDATQDILTPDKSRAYIFGLRKILPFNKSKNENLLIGIEVTQLQENSIDNIKAGYEWYVSKNIMQGYTNNGEVLGAGIGPGGNLQSLTVSWMKGLKKLGIQVERYVHNNDFYYYAYYDSSDFRRHWVDLSVGLNGEWNYKNLIFNAKLQGIKSLNYQWYLDPVQSGIYFGNGINALNVQIQAGATYRF